MGIRQNRQGRYFYDRYLDGRRIRRVIPEARTKSEALKAEVVIVSEIFKRKYDPEVKRKLFTEFVRDTFLPYSKTNKRTHYDDEIITRVLCDFFKGKFLDEITPGIIETYKQKRIAGPTKQGSQRAPATVNREFSVLSRILTLAVNEGLLHNNPCRLVKRFRVDNGRIRYLSAEEEARLMKALEAQPLTKRIVTMALYTGMRRGEIFNLKWSEVDFDRDLIHVRQTKTAKDRVIPISPRIREMLAEQVTQQAVSTDGYVFPSGKTGGRLTHTKNSFRTACDTAGLTDFRFHDLRHSAGTRLAEAGVNIVVIAEILGHGSLTMTKRYTHATDAANREAMQKLARLVNHDSAVIGETA